MLMLVPAAQTLDPEVFLSRWRVANALLGGGVVALRAGTGRAHHLFADVIYALVNALQKFGVIMLQLPPAGGEKVKRNPVIESGREGGRVLRPGGQIADLTVGLAP